MSFSEPPCSSSKFPSASTLIARFLRSNGFTDTLDAFIREGGLPPDVGLGSSDGDDDDDEWTIEGVIQEKKTFDKAVKFERYRDDEGSGSRKWSVPGKEISLFLVRDVACLWIMY
jgi:hypothetical protein